LPVDLDGRLGERPSAVGVDQLEEAYAGGDGRGDVVAAGDGLLEDLLCAHECVLVGPAATQGTEQGFDVGDDAVGRRLREHLSRWCGEGRLHDAGLAELGQYPGDLPGQLVAQLADPRRTRLRLRRG